MPRPLSGEERAQQSIERSVRRLIERAERLEAEAARVRRAVQIIEDEFDIRSPRRSPAVSKESLHTETAQPVQTLSPASESAGAGPACKTCGGSGTIYHGTTAPFGGIGTQPYTKVTSESPCPDCHPEYPTVTVVPDPMPNHPTMTGYVGSTPADDGLDIPAGLDRRGK